MTATTTQTLHLLDCPACGEPIEAAVTYDVHLDRSTDTSATEKTVTVKATMTGARSRATRPTWLSATSAAAPRSSQAHYGRVGA